MEQKFKRGNLVKVLVGQLAYRGGLKNCSNVWVDMQPEDVGKLAVIVGSYNELYGGGDMDSYKITFCDTGITMSWKQTKELEFIDEGGEFLIKEAQETLHKNIKEGKVRPVS